MDNEDNADLWYGSTDEMLNTREERVLLCHWVERSWEKYHHQTALTYGVFSEKPVA